MTSSILHGLTSEKAAQLLKEYGKNELKDFSKNTPLQILLRQVKGNTIALLLFLAALVSFFVGEKTSAITICIVILIMIAVGFFQEYRAEEAIKSLKQMIFPKTNVVRDGKRTEIYTSELVPGDIVFLGNGEKIPADCTLLEEHELIINEATLTGESKEVSKNLTDNNQIYMGTFIARGRCVAEIVHTGMNTKFGAIAHLISTAEKELPLQKKVNDMAKFMVNISIIVSLSIGAIMVYRAERLDGPFVINTLILLVALAVSAFPEGLPVVLTTTLALGAKRMSAKNAIVNRMSVIETLGETTVICSDKTGTITKGEMTVKYIFTHDKLFNVEGTGYAATGAVMLDKDVVDVARHSDLEMLLKTAILCNDADIELTQNDTEYKVYGTPTEAALLILGAKTNNFKENYQAERLEELTFSSEKKMMSTLTKTEKGTYVFAKGAPEVLIQKCTSYLDGDTIKPLDTATKNKFEMFQQSMAAESYRTLGFAYKQITSITNVPTYNEEELTFVGMVALEDPPREEVRQAVETAMAAGIRIILISGDNSETVKSIAKQIGLQGNSIDGFQMDQMSNPELKIALKEANIFSRVKPEHKIRIVKILKAQGEIVAMTGDGVNDAPALKEAHIGIAMGKNGTDTSRAAADITLKDDNFATIISAIAEGRIIFSNIRKFVSYQLSCTISELLILFLGVLMAPYLGWEIPILVSMQILFMNVVTDNMPALTLGFNPGSNDVMNAAPRKNGKLVNKTLALIMLINGILMAVGTLVGYHVTTVLLHQAAEYARTTAMITLILLEIAAAFNYRSFRKGTLSRSPFVNTSLLWASLFSLILTIVFIYTPLHIYLESPAVPFENWKVALVITLAFTVIADITKLVASKSKNYLVDVK